MNSPKRKRAMPGKSLIYSTFLVLWLCPQMNAQTAISSGSVDTAEAKSDSANATTNHHASIPNGKRNRKGIAVRYPEDVDIESDKRVLTAVNFEDDHWEERLESFTRGGAIFPVTKRNRIASFDEFRGRALAIKVNQGNHYGGSLEYIFADHQPSPEPEAVFFRYYLRFGQDWDGQGGKLPGFGGTYDRAGWGGRPSDGYNGWSARGAFGKAPNGKVSIGTYCYHADMTGQYGSVWGWERESLGLLEKTRWYCIEQYLQLNTPKMRDGVIRAWVDGSLAFEKTDIKFRNTNKLKIEKIWFNVYHGGKVPAASDDHLFVDNIVIADSYIGPLCEVGD